MTGPAWCSPSLPLPEAPTLAVRFPRRSFAFAHGSPEFRAAALCERRRREGRVADLSSDHPAKLVRRRLAGDLADFPDTDVGGEIGLFRPGRRSSSRAPGVAPVLRLVTRLPPELQSTAPVPNGGFVRRRSGA